MIPNATGSQSRYSDSIVVVQCLLFLPFLWGFYVCVPLLILQLSHIPCGRWSWLFCCNCVLRVTCVSFCVLCLFLKVPWVGLLSMIAAFPDNTQSFLAGVNLRPVEFFN